jgi:hypothetical protein
MMKTTILIKEGRTQLVLHPESDHDSDVVEVLTKLPNTHRTNLYDRQGGFTAFTEYGNAFGDHSSNQDLMIVFDEATDAKDGSGDHANE